MKHLNSFCTLIFIFLTYIVVNAQIELEILGNITFPEGEEFICATSNNGGSDLNNDGFDDFLYVVRNYETHENKIKIIYGASNSSSLFVEEHIIDFDYNPYPSWGGDLNGDGYKDIIFTRHTEYGDAGDILICFGGSTFDFEPDVILFGENYSPNSYNLMFGGTNSGYDFNGDGFDDILAGASGPDMLYNGQRNIFFGGENMDNLADFSIQGESLEDFGKYSAAGDINGDGFDDLIASRQIDPDEVHVKLEIYLGGDDMDTVMDAEIPDTWMYISNILLNGDFNNDGFNDLLIKGVTTEEEVLGAFYFGNYDLVFSPQYYDINPDGAFSYINLNNDGFTDIVSAYKYNNEGHIRVFLGNNECDFVPDYELNFGDFDDQYGRIGCNFGDLNSDGKDELIINDGEPGNSVSIYGYTCSSTDNTDIESIANLINYPNPFNPSTTINFSLTEKSNIELSIYNIKGQMVNPLIKQSLNKGNHTLTWNGKDSSDNSVSSGIYFCKLNVNGRFEKIRKCLLMK